MGRGPLRLPVVAAEAHHRLRAAVAEAAARGQPPPCTADPGPWLDGDPAARQAAAARCGHCPALDPCRRYADLAGEAHHVWAGQDRTARTR